MFIRAGIQAEWKNLFLMFQGTNRCWCQKLIMSPSTFLTTLVCRFWHGTLWSFHIIFNYLGFLKSYPKSENVFSWVDLALKYSNFPTTQLHLLDKSLWTLPFSLISRKKDQDLISQPGMLLMATSRQHTFRPLELTTAFSIIRKENSCTLLLSSGD